MMISRNTKQSVIVGFDGRAAARAAVPIAAGEAELRGTTLRIVHVVEAAAGSSSGPGIPPGQVDADLAEEAAELARLTLAADRIRVETVHGWVLDELLVRSVEAEMLVVGRGHPSALGVLVGSVALGATTRAHCPVLVVPDPRPGGGHPGGIVVVGVDGIEDSAAALEEAFTEAHLRRVQLVAIHTSRWPGSMGPGDVRPLFHDPLGLDGDATRALREAVEPYRARFPLVGVTEQLDEGSTARVLVDTSAEAGLLVVGTRGRGGGKGMLLGSVGQHVVRHATCPVLVARPRESAIPGAAPTRSTASSLV